MVVDQHLCIENIEAFDDLFLVCEVAAEQREFKFLTWQAPRQSRVPKRRAIRSIERRIVTVKEVRISKREIQLRDEISTTK